MKTTAIRISSLVFVFSVVIFSTAFSAGTLRKSFTVGSGGTLNFSGERCHIVLEGSSRSDIQLRAECGEDIEDHYEVSFEQSGESLEIRVETLYEEKTRSRFFGLFISTSQRFGLKSEDYLTFTVSVPQDFNPCIKDSRGRVEIRSISGRVEAYNSRGPVTVEGVSGSVTVHNSRGPVTLARIDGKLEVRNSRGSINVEDASGDSRLVNSRGSIELKNFKGTLETCNSRGHIKVTGLEGKIKADNSRSRIEVEFCSAPAEDCRLSASRGDIDLSLPGEMGANISAQANRGKIASEIPLMVVGEVGKSRLEGRMADGGPRIELTTSRGDIRIKTAKDEASGNPRS